MKKLSYIFILVVLPMLSFGNKQLMVDAYYAKGQYKEAAAGYQQMVNDGYKSAVIYYNLGNAYYKLGDIPSALLYYEKAHKLSPGDDDINFNIRYVNSKTTDKVEDAPSSF
jgi:tetratricopeptide (TPR) repeat protein